MSDDFAGELQDMEDDKKEGEDSDSGSEEEGDEELDKQMDKVGDESDKLDEKLWGSDEEEEDQDQEQDEGPGDGKTSEQEIIYEKTFYPIGNFNFHLGFFICTNSLQHIFFLVAAGN